MHFIVLLCKNANCKSATCNRVQLQNRLAGHSLLGDDISLRICLVVGILCILIDGSHILLSLVEASRGVCQALFRIHQRLVS
jgi:hypothetical protein